MSKENKIILSIVSHGQLSLIDALLLDLREKLGSTFGIVLTLNIPEDETVLERYTDLPITIIRNAEPKGFGSNHNAAFHAVPSDVFVIVNPDIRIKSICWDELFAPFTQMNVGACAPIVLSSEGTIEDSARRFPTVTRLFTRVVLRQRKPDFIVGNVAGDIDWAAGMFVAYRSSAYARIGGFDERFFMYMEDADICRRLAKAGYRTVMTPKVTVIHQARRASRRNLRHLRWHIGSTLRFLFLAESQVSAQIYPDDTGPSVIR